MDPRLPKAYVDRALAYEHKNDFDRAIADFSEAIRLTGEVYIRRGVSYAQIGDCDRAIADFTEAIRLNPHCDKRFPNRK